MYANATSSRGAKRLPAFPHASTTGFFSFALGSNLARVLDETESTSDARREAPNRARRPSAPNSSRQAKPHSNHRYVVLAVALTALIAICITGAGYYAAPMGIRVRHPLHAWLKPSGIIGQAAGILAFSIFIFLWLYPLRKRFKSLAWTGSVGRWLDVHVSAALLLPLLLAIHAAWRFEGVIGLGYTAIMLVCASGVVGRYLYTRIPRARSGVELTRDEVLVQRAALIERITATTGLTRDVVEGTLKVHEPGQAGNRIGRSMLDLVAGDLIRWRRVRQLKTRWIALAPAGRRPSSHALDEALRLASRELALAQQVKLLEATHRVFKWWHVAHRPFALTALIAVIIHVIVVVAVGATWVG
jgi:hypothetical protein